MDAAVKRNSVPPAGVPPAEQPAIPEQPQPAEQPPAEPSKDDKKRYHDKREPPERKKKFVHKDKNAKGKREYLYWEDANNIEWRREIEYKGYLNWKLKFGPGTEWGKRYEQWICSGMTRGVMRKPSFRALEWVKYQRGIEIAPVGENCTRRRCSIRDYFVEPVDSYCCRPCPWPVTTAGEVGWLGQHKSCQLEIYPNDFMKKPPLPWHHRKISSQMPGTM